MFGKVPRLALLPARAKWSGLLGATSLLRLSLELGNVADL